MRSLRWTSLVGQLRASICMSFDGLADLTNLNQLQSITSLGCFLLAILCLITTLYPTLLPIHEHLFANQRIRTGDDHLGKVLLIHKVIKVILVSFSSGFVLHGGDVVISVL